MIYINLVPQHMRKRRRGSGMMAKGFVLPKEIMVGIIGGFVALIFCVIVGLQMLIIFKQISQKNLSGQMETIAQDKANVDRILADLRNVQSQIKSYEEVSSRGKFSLSNKLNSISESLPRGVWLSRLTFESGYVRLQGSAVSKKQTEMLNVHNFTSNLKKDAAFSKDFSKIELEFIKSRKVNTTPVADFTIVGETSDGE